MWIATFSLLGSPTCWAKSSSPTTATCPILGVGRLALAIVTFSLVVSAALPGMWGAPLKGLSGYLPPLPHAGLRHRTTGRLRTGPGRRRGAHAADRRRTETPNTATSSNLPHNLERYSSISRRPRHTPPRSASRSSSTSRATDASTAAKWRPAYGPTRRCWTSCATTT